MPTPQPNPHVAENNARNLPRNDSSAITHRAHKPDAADMAFARVLEYALRMSPAEREAWIKNHCTEVATPFGTITFLVNPFLQGNQFQIIQHRHE